MTAWTNKSKTSAALQKGRLLTPDNNQILVGSNVDEVLIYQRYQDTWSKKLKTNGSWTNKTKVSA